VHISGLDIRLVLAMLGIIFAGLFLAS